MKKCTCARNFRIFLFIGSTVVVYSPSLSGKMTHDVNFLTLQERHISAEVLRGLSRSFQFKHCEETLAQLGVLDHRVAQKLSDLHLYGVFKTIRMNIDQDLITGLIERWRPETHTFHLVAGEATVTLQDVSLLWGIPIHGRPMLERQPGRTAVQWQMYSAERFGWMPNLDELTRTHFKLTSLSDWIDMTANRPGPHTDDVDAVKYARAMALLILAGSLFPETHGNKAPLFLMDFLRDDDLFKTYSLGSAVLAYLYRMMCRGAVEGKKTLAGPIRLLQLWAYIRMSDIRPHLRRRFADDIWEVDTIPLISWRFIGHVVRKNVPTNKLRMIRDALDGVGRNGFEWTPYDSEFIGRVPAQCRAMWFYTGKVLYLNRCEPHHVDRVARQFGFTLVIPSPPSDIFETCHLALDVLKYQWDTRFVDYVAEWDSAPAEHVYTDDATRAVSEDQYHVWYDRRTILFLGTQSTDETGWRGGAADQIYRGARELQRQADGPPQPERARGTMRSMMSFLFRPLRGARGAGPSDAHAGQAEDISPHCSPPPVVHHSPAAPPPVVHHSPEAPPSPAGLTHSHDDQVTMDDDDIISLDPSFFQGFSDHVPEQTYFPGESSHQAQTSFQDIFSPHPSLHATPSMPDSLSVEPQSQFPIQPVFQQPQPDQPPFSYSIPQHFPVHSFITPQPSFRPTFPHTPYSFHTGSSMPDQLQFQQFQQFQQQQFQQFQQFQQWTAMRHSSPLQQPSSHPAFHHSHVQPTLTPYPDPYSQPPSHSSYAFTTPVQEHQFGPGVSLPTPGAPIRDRRPGIRIREVSDPPSPPSDRRFTRYRPSS